jgi:hypothetical protein
VHIDVTISLGLLLLFNIDKTKVLFPLALVAFTDFGYPV